MGKSLHPESYNDRINSSTLEGISDILTENTKSMISGYVRKIGDELLVRELIVAAILELIPKDSYIYFHDVDERWFRQPAISYLISRAVRKYGKTVPEFIDRNFNTLEELKECIKKRMNERKCQNQKTNTKNLKKT